LADLTRRAAEGRPVTLGVVGAGQMGTDLAVQVSRIPGMRLGGIAVRNVTNAIEMAVSVGHRRDRVVTAKPRRLSIRPSSGARYPLPMTLRL